MLLDMAVEEQDEESFREVVSSLDDLRGRIDQVELECMFSGEHDGKNAILTITNKTTGEEVARINLADCLAQGRGAFEARHYSAQEFLDREYDYKLDFFLQGNQWKYMQLSISILHWSKRIQRVDF